MADPALPTLEDVNTKVCEAYGIHHLAQAGIIKLSGTIKMGPLGLTSKIEQWFDARNIRTEIKGWTSSTTVIVRGDQVALSSNGGKTFQLQSGIVREQEVLGHPAVHYGDWNSDKTHMEILKPLRVEDQHLLLVRAEVNDLPGSTILIDTDSGLVSAEHSLQYLPGAGYIGVETTYGDFRKVAGLTLPFRSESKFANPLIGKVIIEFESFELGLEAAELFEIRDK